MALCPTYRQAIEPARQGSLKENAARIAAREAATEALVGNETQARAGALAVLTMQRSRETMFFLLVLCKQKAENSGLVSPSIRHTDRRLVSAGFFKRRIAT
jgi:hypothetical protein